MSKSSKSRPHDFQAGVPGRATGHPLLRILSGAPTNYTGGISSDINAFVRVVGKVFGWSKVRGVRGVPNLYDITGTDKMRRWLDATPLVYAWVSSDRFLVAPPAFPDSVRMLLYPFHVSPYEMSFYILGQPRRIDPFEGAVLLAFCCGLSLQEIALMINVSAEAVVALMHEAMRNYLEEDVRLRLWSWSIDWSTAMIPSDVDQSILTRLDIKNTLMSGKLFDVVIGSTEYRRIEVVANSERMQRMARLSPKVGKMVPGRWLTKGLVQLGPTNAAGSSSGA